MHIPVRPTNRHKLNAVATEYMLYTHAKTAGSPSGSVYSIQEFEVIIR